MIGKGTQALDRGLALLTAIVRDDGYTPAATLAAGLDLAPSSGRRMLATLERHGLVGRIARGRYAGTERLVVLASRIDPRRRLIEAGRSALRRLARAESAAAHLGVFDGDMVSYLVKEGGADVFTREHGQLEAYCTGIGKVLLAQLPPDRLEIYLRGTFVRLTAQTLVDADALRSEIAATNNRGYAIDDREMADDIACVAVPVTVDGRAVAAISISGTPASVPLSDAERMAARLAACARSIAERMA